MIGAIERAASSPVPIVALVVVVEELLHWIVLLLSLPILVVDIIRGQFLSARRTRVVFFKPRHDALLVKHVLARQLKK
jgi:hypothetical protein